MASCGMAAWPPLPLIIAPTLSAEASMAPGRQAMTPPATFGKMCSAKAASGSRIVKQSLLDHVPRAVHAFFARLEHEEDRARDVIAPAAQDPRGAGQHRRMGVVAAGMHVAGCARGEVEPGFLVDRKGVHVAAQQHGPARLRAVEPGDEAAGRLAVADRQRQVGQRRLQFLGRARAIESQFRLGMDGAAQRDKLGVARFGGRSPIGQLGDGHRPSLAADPPDLNWTSGRGSARRWSGGNRRRRAGHWQGPWAAWCPSPCQI